MQRGKRIRLESDGQTKAARAERAKKARKQEGSKSQNNGPEANLYNEASLETVNQLLFTS